MAPLLLRIYGERHDEQWVLMCLDFSLCVQADTLPEAQQKLKEQVVMYIKDATAGPDQDYASALLARRAPLQYWAKFYFYRFLGNLRGNGKRGSHHAAMKPVPLVPAFA